MEYEFDVRESCHLQNERIFPSDFSPFLRGLVLHKHSQRAADATISAPLSRFLFLLAQKCTQRRAGNSGFSFRATLKAPPRLSSLSPPASFSLFFFFFLSQICEPFAQRRLAFNSPASAIPPLFLRLRRWK